MLNSRFTLLTLLCLLSLTAFAQIDKKAIEDSFKSYTQTLIDKDFAKSVSYLPEEIFQFVKKEQLIQIMEVTMNNPSIAYKIGGFDSITFQDIVQSNAKYYALMSYVSHINMKFLPEDENETVAQSKTRNNTTKLALQNAFGTDNVQLDEETNWFYVKARKKCCASSVDGKTNWKFVVIEPKQRILLDKILPKEIRDKL